MGSDASWSLAHAWLSAVSRLGRAESWPRRHAGRPHSPARRQLLATIAGLACTAALLPEGAAAQLLESTADASAKAGGAEAGALAGPSTPEVGDGAAASGPAEPRLAAASPGVATRGVPLGDRLRVEQDPTFLTPVLASLDKLSALQDTSWGDLVASNLLLVRPARSGELPEGAFAGMLVGADGERRGGTAIFGSTKADVYYLASVIVHEAWHYHQFQGSGPYYGRAAEQEAIGVQVDVLRALRPNHYALGYLQDSIATVSDGGPLAGNPLR
jgi:hypothetical protein